MLHASTELSSKDRKVFYEVEIESDIILIAVRWAGLPPTLIACQYCSLASSWGGVPCLGLVRAWRLFCLTLLGILEGKIVVWATSHVCVCLCNHIYFTGRNSLHGGCEVVLLLWRTRTFCVAVFICLHHWQCCWNNKFTLMQASLCPQEQVIIPTNNTWRYLCEAPSLPD